MIAAFASPARALLGFTLARYAIAGLTATGVNFLLRMALSLAMPFAHAVALAQAVGFLTGFVLYKYFVFTDARTRLPAQIGAFGLVNLVSFTLVLIVSIQMRAILISGAPALALFYIEALAHVCGLASGALVNFLGHRLVTFAPRRG